MQKNTWSCRFVKVKTVYDSEKNDEQSCGKIKCEKIQNLI